MSKIKRYTKEEEDIILKNSTKKASKKSYEELALMMNRTVEGIRKKELDLKRKAQSNKRKNENWTDKQIDKLKEILDKDNFNINDLKSIKGKSIESVKEKALELRTSINHNNGYNRPWTDEEYDYLKRWWGIEDDTTIGIYLGRSREALRNKAKKLGMCSKKTFYSARECAGILSITDNVLLTYIQKGYINSRLAKMDQLMYQIKHEELVEFMENHQDKWDSRKLTKDVFIIEKPKWFIDKCKNDRLLPIDYYSKCKKWTGEEVKTMFDMKKEGFTFSDIAKRLNRTPISVENRYRRNDEIEENKRLRKIKEDEYRALDRLKKEYENEKSYILRQVQSINARQITEDDIELLSTLRMLGFDRQKISELTKTSQSTPDTVLNKYKDEEYVLCINRDKMDDTQKEELFNFVKDNSLYETAYTFNRAYTFILNTYQEILDKKYVKKKDDRAISWNREDYIKMLLYKKQGMKSRTIAFNLNKTSGSIKSKYSMMFRMAYKPKDDREWTKQEIELISLYEDINEDLDRLKIGLQRTIEAIIDKHKEIKGVS